MVAIDSETQDHHIAYEDVKEFLDGLNQSGFKVSLHQYTSANRLLLGLMSNEWILRNPRSLRTYLAPVICSTPAEQEDFYRLFDEWLRRIEPAAVIDVDEVDSTQSGPSITPTPPNPSFLNHNVREFIVPVFLLIAVLAALYYVRRETAQRTLTVRVVEANTSTPIADAEVSFAGLNGVTDSSGFYRFTYRPRNATPVVRASSRGYLSDTVQVTTDNQSVELALNPDRSGSGPGHKTSPSPSPLQTPVVTNPKIDDPNVYAQKQIAETNKWSSTDVYLRNFVLILIGVVALPFVVFLGWRIWWILRRRQLERWRTREQPELFSLAVKGVANHLYRSPAFRTFAQELRRHRRLKSSTLDASASVDATSDAGGLFTPVFESRQLTPEYLVLIDAESFQDQKAHLDEEIIGRLQREGVFVDRYYFNGDPRVCQTRQPQTSYRTIEEMATRHPDHRLVVFSNGAGLIDPLSGRPHSWVEQFSHWPIRALITAENTWGYREWALEQTGLTVLPAAEEGLLALGKLIQSVEGPPRASIIGNQRDDFYPPQLLENSKRWISRKSPPAEEIEELVYELRFYLGNEGFYLLCACAVYPALIWDLTLYFSSHLVDPKNVESTLAALVRLPWFRAGEMPDWLRRHLIARLPPPREAVVRKLLERLLMSYVENPKQGFDLEIVREPAPQRSQWRERLVTAWQKLREWKRKKFLHDVIRTAPDDSLFREYVFLNFMSRSKLAVLLPWRLRRLLYLKGQPILGLHPVRAVVLPLVFAIVGGVGVTAIGAGLTTGDGPGPRPTPTPTPPLSNPTRFDPELYRVRFAVNLPAGVPDLKGKTYANALRLINTADTVNGTQIGTSVSNAILIDRAECVRDVGVQECVDLIFNVQSRSAANGRFELVDGETGGSVPIPVFSEIYKLRVNNIDLNARTITTTIRSQTNTVVSGPTLALRQGQSFGTITVRLPSGPSVLTATDGQQVKTVEIVNANPEQLAVIRVNFTDAANGRPLGGTFVVEDLVPRPGLPPRVGSGERTVYPGNYRVIGSVAGYEPQAQTVTAVERQTVTVDFKLQRTDTPTPTPTPTSTPIPTPTATPTPDPTPTPVMIVSVGLTFTIQENDKDDGSAILAQILLDGEPIASETYGEGVTWKTKTRNDFTLVLSRPLVTSDCHRMVLQLRNKRNEPGEDTWLMQVIATIKLSDGDSRSIVFESLRLFQDRPYQNNFRCPASRLGPGMF